MMDSALVAVVPDEYSSIDSAVSHLLGSGARGGAPALIRIASGYTVKKGVVFRDGDYSWLRISAEDDCVHARVSGDVIACYNASGPRISCLFDMGGQGRNGVRLQDGSRICIDAASGVINAGNIGLRMYSCCSVVARGARFSGAAKHGIWMEQSSVGDLDGADVSNASGTGLHVNHASRATARNVLALGAGQEGVYARHASTITFWKGRAENCGAYDLRVEAASLIDAWGASYATDRVNAVVNSFGPSGQIVDRRKPVYEDCGEWRPRLYSSKGELIKQLESVAPWRRIGQTVFLSCDVLVNAKPDFEQFPLCIRGLPFQPVQGILSICFLKDCSSDDEEIGGSVPWSTSVHLAHNGAGTVQKPPLMNGMVFPKSRVQGLPMLRIRFSATFECCKAAAGKMVYPTSSEA